jgi:DNA-binding beta-propeller fold protein YncE/thiol-disulfide isomerase/thioredoxin
MRPIRSLLLFAVGASALGAVYFVKRGGLGTAEETHSMAPELSGAVAWLNTDHPITIAELRGRVVILDFWTYGCINCMHVLPVLHHLEETYAGQPLEIIGVHSAKFENEKAPDRVRAAVERYGITHPVAVDSEMAIWDHYGVRAWPTLVVIRPDGRVAEAIPGEATFEQLDELVRHLMKEARAAGKLASGPALPHRSQSLATGELAYPGKVIAAPDGRLFISDSRNHRVLIATADGRILDQIGSGKQGRKDGSFEAAELDDPQGMALAGDTLYLADARGYAVLKIDLKTREVATLAGTGRLGREPLDGPVKAASLDIRSPWDVALQGPKLYVAMAGSHQIGVIDLDKGTLARFAGSGREDIRDGSSDLAAFAQPSGLSFSADGKTLFVADSESSGIRTIDLATGETHTLLGTGLFEWGDGEGALRPKLIQHPLGVAAGSAGLWVADSYNGKVKLIDRANKLTTKVAQAAGKALSDPGGIWVESDGSVLIADTGNDRILRLLPGATEPLVLPVGKREAAAQALGNPIAPRDEKLPVVELGPHELPAGAQTIRLALIAPKGFEFSAGAPWSASLTGDGQLKIQNPSLTGESLAGSRVELQVQAEVTGPESTLSAVVHANICDAVNHAACYPVRARYAVLIRTTSKGAQAPQPIELELLPPAKPGGGH